MEGTDAYLNNALFERYRKQLQCEEYASLQWNCLTITHIDEVIEANNLYKRKIKKENHISFSYVRRRSDFSFIIFLYA